MENWKLVTENPKYEVSDLGRVRHVGTKKLVATAESNGYTRVGFGPTRFVHRLVAKAFLPPDPARPTINHKNGKKKDNRAVNLERATLVENNAHSAHKRCAATNPKRAFKLTPAIVRSIRKRHASGERSSAIAEDVGISTSMLRHVVARRFWKEVT